MLSSVKCFDLISYPTCSRSQPNLYNFGCSIRGLPESTCPYASYKCMQVGYPRPQPSCSSCSTANGIVDKPPVCFFAASIDSMSPWMGCLGAIVTSGSCPGPTVRYKSWSCPTGEWVTAIKAFVKNPTSFIQPSKAISAVQIVCSGSVYFRFILHLLGTSCPIISEYVGSAL